MEKEFHFEAAHRLPQLPATHRCHRLHGHSYRVVVVLEATELDARGFAGGLDYADLDWFGDFLKEHYDHRYLNDFLREATTAEHLARLFFQVCKQKWPQTAAVRVSETAKTWVSYRE